MNILCVTDKEGRIQYNRMVLFRDMMSDHNIDIVTLSDRKRINFSKYDTVYYSNFSIYDRVPCPNNVRKLASVTSHKCLISPKKTYAKLSNFDAISVNNTFLLSAIKPYVPNLYYTPNGVDTNFFSFSTKNLCSQIVIGWVGNRDRATKRFKEILSPLIKRCSDVNFKVIAPSKSDHVDKLLTSEQMRDFYHGLDFFIVTSATEGTPNPALEAMSCGVPVISSRVGNMVEIIKDGENGFLVGGALSSYISAINNIRDIKDYSAMRESARENMEYWDWSHKIRAWSNFFSNG